MRRLFIEILYFTKVQGIGPNLPFMEIEGSSSRSHELALVSYSIEGNRRGTRKENKAPPVTVIAVNVLRLSLRFGSRKVMFM
jgi:hypothetical protein